MDKQQKVEKVKLYARIDDDFENIEDYINAAEEYISSCGVNEAKLVKDGREELYLLSVKMLTKHWYDNRDLSMSTNKKEMPLGFNALVNKLQFLSRESVI